MKKLLIRCKPGLYWRDDKDVVHEDGSLPKNLYGDCTGLRGDCTYLRGNCTYLRGDCTGLSGDIDACGITDDERKAGVDILVLTIEEKANNG